jgi:hypothetical protein
MDKEKMKAAGKELTALEPILVTKLGSKLKPHIRIIYFVLMGLLALMALGTIAHLFTKGFSIFIFELVLLFISFVVVRMFCEYVNKE